MGMPFEKALVLSREAARCLGGEQQEAIELVCRAAERGGRRPSEQLDAAADHFRAARAELDETKK